MVRSRESAAQRSRRANASRDSEGCVIGRRHAIYRAAAGYCKLPDERANRAENLAARLSYSCGVLFVIGRALCLSPVFDVRSGGLDGVICDAVEGSGLPVHLPDGGSAMINSATVLFTQVSSFHFAVGAEKVR